MTYTIEYNIYHTYVKKKKKKVGSFLCTSHFSVVFSVLYFTFTLKLRECNTGD